jgi:hypothetical protein
MGIGGRWFILEGFLGCLLGLKRKARSNGFLKSSIGTRSRRLRRIPKSLKILMSSSAN